MAHSTSDTAFATLVKSMTYRGAREEWSNAYHFDQVPPDDAHWGNLCSAIWALEKVFLPADVQLERYLGHTPGTPPVLVFELDINPPGEGGDPGTWVPGGAEYPTSGDVAGWIRYGTTQKSVLGKPIYLRNYYHGLYAWGDKDEIASNQITGMEALGAAMVQGIVAVGTTYRRAGPRGAVAQNHQVGAFLTTRTLKRRGRRHKKLPSGSTVQLPSIVIE